MHQCESVRRLLDWRRRGNARSKKPLNPPRFAVMQSSEPGQNFFAIGGKRNIHHPAVSLVLLAAHQAVLRGTLNQANNRMRSLLQKLGKFGNSSGAAPRVPCHSKQKLMLLRGNSALPRGIFTEPQKPAQRVAKLGKVADILLTTLRPGSAGSAVFERREFCWGGADVHKLCRTAT